MLAETVSRANSLILGGSGMHGLTIYCITSAKELRKQAERWDDLWRRSASTRPTAQAEQLISWKESFAAERDFCPSTYSRRARP